MGASSEHPSSHGWNHPDRAQWLVSLSLCTLMSLDHILKAEIRHKGSIPLEDYMALCLRHPQYGYYTTQNPLGSKGDFTTSPEISQLFGEMVALWCVQSWEGMGSPSSFHICELGPGRGALIADLVRTLQKFPSLFQALHVHLVDIHPTLCHLQQCALKPWISRGDLTPSWTSHWPSEVLKGPTLVIANEFWDALPLKQSSWDGEQWWNHHVTFDEIQEQYVILKVPTSSPPLLDRTRLPPGWIEETAPEMDAWLNVIACTLNTYGGGGLWIDYGPDFPTGLSTWRGFERHHPCDPLTSQGRIDITADVNFHKIRLWAHQNSYPITLESQHHFLRRMGIDYRLQRMVATAHSHEEMTDLLTSYHRIMEDLGRSFKVCAFETAHS